MKDLDYRKIMDNFQYKPNFGFHIFNSFDGRGKMLKVVMMVENSRGPFRPWEIKPIPQDEEAWYSERWLDKPPRGPEVGYSPSRALVELSGNYAIPPFVEGDDDLFIQFVIGCIKKVEDHEMFEWLRYKGELIDDPHKDD